MDDSELIADYYDMKPSSGFLMTIMSGLLFQLLHCYLERIVSPPSHLILGPKPHNHFEFDYWKWKNLCLSWVHAVICGTMVIFK